MIDEIFACPIRKYNIDNNRIKLWASGKYDEETLKVLADNNVIIDNFFDKVIVNDENLNIKKNRLELLQMFCNTYNNFIDFSKIEGA